MKILDRFIIKQFLVNFIVLFAVLMSLFVLVDLIVNLDEFLEAGQHRADRELIVAAAREQGLDADRLYSLMGLDIKEAEVIQRMGMTREEFDELTDGIHASGLSVTFWTLWTIGNFYGPRIVLNYVFLSGLLVVGAMGFTMTSLHRSRELTAILASGVSLYRVAMPVLVAGAVLNFITLPAQELLIPRMAGNLIRTNSEVQYDAVESFAVHFAPDRASGALLSAASFDVEHGQLNDVTILERDERGITSRRIRAAQAVWQEDEGRWQLYSGVAMRPAVMVAGEPALDPEEALEPADYFTTDLSPRVLLAKQATLYPRLLPLPELMRMQGNEAVEARQRARLTGIVWSRFSLLVLNVLVLVMGLPFFLLRAPANLMVQSIRAATVVLSTWGSGLVMLQMNAPWLNPVAGAWLPVVMALPVSVVLLLMVKT